MKSLCLIVPKKEGEKVRKKLLDEELLRADLKIERNDKALFIPISKPIDIGYQIEEREFVAVQKPVGDYRDLIDLPSELRELLPSSMDIIGDIAVVRLPEELKAHKRYVGLAIASAKKAKTVAVDKGVEGDLRLRDLELLVGKETSTIHKEYGQSYELDVRKVYFSPRLSTERWRIANLVKDGETIIDMFCGVGPFSIMIAKHRSPKRIYAIDINPTAVEYMKRNIIRNRVDKVVLILGDAMDVVKNLEKADRIIMNLPLASFQFFEAALSAAKDNGIIHYYEILSVAEAHEREKQLKEKSSRLGRELNIKMREVKSYSSTKAHFAFDLEIQG